jgi:hypothetical protein
LPLHRCDTKCGAKYRHVVEHMLKLVEHDVVTARKPDETAFKRTVSRLSKSAHRPV